MDKSKIRKLTKGYEILFILIISVSLLSGVNYATAQTNSTNQSITQSNNASISSDFVSSNGTLSLSNSTFPLQRENANYYDNVSGYLVFPENSSSVESSIAGTKLPAVIMIHEWWGLNDNIKNMADELAKEGYVVLAIDLYKGQVATSPDQAMELVNLARENQNESLSNLKAAVGYLKTLDNVNASKIAAIGWCFGGGQALQLALNSNNDSQLAATILYYGNLVTDQEQLSKITGPVLGIFGDQDQSIPTTDVQKFEDALNANNITNEIYVYEGVGHAFANPTGASFAPHELKDAWQKTLEFLNKNLKDN
ncbi:MAG: dienelactone hydrolase family protein [Candidatus Nitrosocosmicus sp.]|nr:dienelactone hydrolase family protein [Candidatus Nitrosocosmicus sp.]MDN5867686.1 dienelactone hydrolase family protein [Candidatus Nitrosocosmicus sp.]